MTVEKCIHNFIFIWYGIEFQSKKKNIEDVDNQRLNALKTEFNLGQVYDAIIWLRANKDRFRAPIYEPPIISVSLFFVYEQVLFVIFIFQNLLVECQKQ